MATLDQLYHRVRNLAYASPAAKRPAFATIDATFNSGNTGMSVDTEFENLFKIGVIGEFSDGDLIRCVEDYGASSVAVQRVGTPGFYDLESDTNHASGDSLEIDPPFTRKLIEQLINEVVRNDLWPHVWTWFSGTITYIDGETTYSLANQYLQEVVRVYQYDIGGFNKFRFIPRDMFEAVRELNTAVDANLVALRLAKVHDSDFDVYYDAKRRPHPDDLANISDEVADLIPWRVCAKLVEANIIPDRVDPPRRRRQNSDGGWARDSRTFNAEFFQMREALRAKLRRDIPEERHFVGVQRNRSW